MRRVLALILSLISVLTVISLPACSASKLYSEGKGELKVVCTVFPIFDFARNVGKDKITVTLLQDSGADMHSYSPTASALKAVGEADVFVYIGGESESAWVEDMIASSQNKKLKTVKLSACIEELLVAESFCDWEKHDHDGHDHKNSFDEHFWTSLENAEDMTEAICSALCEADPENAGYYRQNTENYTEKLDKLDSDYENAFENASASILVFADRFPFVYLMHDYSFNYMAAFGGCSTETDASYETLSKISKAVQENNIVAVFTIDGSDKKLAGSVKEQTGCEVLSVSSLQSVTRSEIENGINYIDVMTENLNAFRIALGTK